MDKKTIRQVKQLALEYRLSLYYVCKILKFNPTEENQEQVCKLMKDLCNDYYEFQEIDYLIYETERETEENNKFFYQLASTIWEQLRNAEKSGDKERIKNNKINLNLTDHKYAELTKKEKWLNVSEDELLIIAKYRIKHCLMIKPICYELGLYEKTLYGRFEKMNNKRFARKSEILNDFFIGDYLNNSKKKVKK